MFGLEGIYRRFIWGLDGFRVDFGEFRGVYMGFRGSRWG